MSVPFNKAGGSEPPWCNYFQVPDSLERLSSRLNDSVNPVILAGHGRSSHNEITPADWMLYTVRKTCLTKFCNIISIMQHQGNGNINIAMITECCCKVQLKNMIKCYYYNAMVDYEQYSWCKVITMWVYYNKNHNSGVMSDWNDMSSNIWRITYTFWQPYTPRTIILE